MPKRIRIEKFSRDSYRDLAALAEHARELSDDAGLGRDLIELLMVRASQLNGCAACLTTHLPAAREAGVPNSKLDCLPTWRSVDIFTPQEATALAYTEAVTQLDPSVPLDASYAALEANFTEEQIAAISWSVIAINAWNRVSILSDHPVMVRNYPDEQ